MKRYSSIFSITAIPYLALFLIGCAGQKYPDGMPKLVPCEITLQQEGQPFADAVVTLIPADVENKWSASGRTDTSGKAIIYTWGKYEGAAEGTYKVVLNKTESVGAPPSASSEEEARRPPDKFFDLVEEIYGDKEKTPLEIELKKGTKSFSLDAGKAVRTPIQVN